jgi:hypothetical protein
VSHERAVNAAINAAASQLTAADGPLCQLARTLAQQMDTSGAEAGTRLCATYMTCVRALSARLLPLIAAGGASVSPLARLRAESSRISAERPAS